jgi:hypothetical protein
MRLVIDLFIVVYLFVAWAWRQPAGTFGRVATEPLVTFLRWSGFGQDWSMFTPDPPVAGADVQIIVKRASGSAILWEPPSMAALSRWSAFRNFRYRTYANALLSTWAKDTARPAVADYLLRKYDYGNDRPIELIYTWIEQPVAPPDVTEVAPVTRSVFHSVTVPDTTV